MYVCGSGKHRYSGSHESEVEEAEKHESPIIVETGMYCEDEHENAIAVQAEIHHESEVADAEIDERPIVIEAGMNCEYEDENAIAAVLINNIKVDQQ